MSEDWNLQTNLKPKPNAQGTLFSGGKSQIPDEKRYPRGYTPVRMQEVKKYAHVDSGNWNEPMKGVHPGGLVEDTYRTLARSTVPAYHLNAVQFHVSNPNASWMMARDGVAGSYSNRTGEMGHIKLSMNAVHDATVIHEVGHHNSLTNDRTEHSRYDSPRKRGEEEGYADAYADEHYRMPPAAKMKKEMRDDSRRGLNRYEPLNDQTRDHSGRTRRADFNNGYDFTRPAESRVPNTTDEMHAKSTATMDAFLARPKQGTLF